MSFCDSQQHPEKVYVRRYRKSCSRAECPICFERWASKEAHAIDERINRFKVSRTKRPIHVVVSPNDGDIQSLDYSKLRSRAYLLLEKIGCIGGSMIVHPFRFDRARGWFFSPHFHAIGYGWIHGTKENFEETGWVIKNLGVRSSVYRTAQYQLSHAGVWMGKGKRTTITWFGALAYNRFSAPRERHSEKCPLCNGALRVLQSYSVKAVFGSGDPPDDIEEGTVSRTQWMQMFDGESPREGLTITSWEVS